MQNTVDAVEASETASQLKVTSGKSVGLSLSVKNTGVRTGAEVAQVYLGLPASAGEPPKRLVAWEKVQLDPGQSRTVTLSLEPQFMSVFNVEKDAWELLPGDYLNFCGRILPAHTADCHVAHSCGEPMRGCSEENQTN